MNIRRYKTGEKETLWHLCRDTTLLIDGQDYGIETEALRLGVESLRVESSTTAKAFFTSMGFEVVEQKHNMTGGIPFISFVMRKRVV